MNSPSVSGTSSLGGGGRAELGAGAGFGTSSVSAAAHARGAVDRRHATRVVGW
eukprot:CAMPEP_0206164236 /NCGR_PEP_ID=MMETSP1474-20131121/15222_1 /ASSEMBLY_ACC=CAM_ASM_001110 /TAXON_ID=97495 /ORGANISM="Imantonia sp., Strain RCC918" /LENGTH=52 /DNA_ID=CAMNT_0053567015 /DNA_START=390 /DNA_END=548 /DNA_ORIENTATION=+